MRRTVLLSLLLAAAVDTFAGTGRIIIVNNDQAGVGFNDTTPATPVGGNTGTTLGQQRLNVFQRAAERWSTMLETNVDILAQASFASIPGCDEESAILGQAAPFTWQHSFAGAPQNDVWYPIALANKYAGVDLDPNSPDIFSRFNADVDNATCLGESNWYYGFDGNNGIHSDLYVVVLHELGHGLGVAGPIRAPAFRQNRPSVFDQNMYDSQAGLRWTQMTEAARNVSMTNTGNLAWQGSNVTANLSRFLQPVTILTLSEPSPIAKNYDVGFADFGRNVSRGGLSGTIIRVTDPSNTDGSSVNDGCSPFTNAAAVNGNVAFIDRGNCTYAIKARNAQAAGATGVIIGDRFESYNAENPATCLPPGMTDNGSAPDVTIPIVSVGINDASSIRAQYNINSSVTVSGLLRMDPSQLAGTTKEGYLRLYAPCTNDPGSSTHHWDTVATPNLLMEPAVNSDLLLGVDLTIYQLLDMGWSLPAKTGRRILKRH
ncbi:MAG TPA: PA domain-containing protein [Thermoanaerobaculia bacterium]|nr:PA domain-containing protein [Thermoanaerobaculia bacterium]